MAEAAEQQMAQAAMEYPPFSQMRVISRPSDPIESPKKPRKTTYQKFTDHEDLWIIKKAIDTRDAFKVGSKREFWRRVQDELSGITGKDYTPFDRHVTGMMKKRRDRLLKMPQDYLDWLDKWILWHDEWTMSGRDIDIDVPEDRDGTRGRFTGEVGFGGGGQGGQFVQDYAPAPSNKRRRTAGGDEFVAPRRGPGRPPRISAPGPGSTTGQGVIRLDDNVVPSPRNNAVIRPPNPNFLPNNVSGLLDAAAADIEEQWMQSSTPEDNQGIDEDLNRIVDRLKLSLDKTSPRTAANSSLLIAIIGLVRDNRTKIIDLEEDIQKEQKKRKWNDDVVWSMVKNKCAELDLDYNQRRRKAPATAGSVGDAEGSEDSAVICELKVSARNIESKVGRLETDLRHAHDEISQLRDVDRQHRTYIDGLKKMLQQRTGGATGSQGANGTQANGADTATVALLHDQVATLISEREADKANITHANSMLWKLEDRLRSLEAPSEAS